MANASAEKIGIVAGWGSFPVEIAQQCLEDGKQIYIAAIKGHADVRLESLATEIRWLGVLKVGSHLNFFAKAGVQQVAWAGKLFKEKILYHGGGWISHFPDITCLRVLGASFVTKTSDARDDTLLTAVVNAYGKRGMQVLPITQIAPALLADEGCLTKKPPRRSQMLDIEFGWKIASQMGGLDIGQSITVKDRVVLGVEAIEGTDALIARTSTLCPRGGFTLIKVAKPLQDMRFDVPTIGLRTVQQLVRAGGSAIAIEAGRTIIVDREQTLRYANANRVAILSLRFDAASAAGSPSACEPTGLNAWQYSSRAA